MPFLVLTTRSRQRVLYRALTTKIGGTTSWHSPLVSRPVKVGSRKFALIHSRAWESNPIAPLHGPKLQGIRGHGLRVFFGQEGPGVFSGGRP